MLVVEGCEEVNVCTRVVEIYVGAGGRMVAKVVIEVGLVVVKVMEGRDMDSSVVAEELLLVLPMLPSPPPTSLLSSSRLLHSLR